MISINSDLSGMYPTLDLLCLSHTLHLHLHLHLQDNDYKSFYKMEVNWGYSSKKVCVPCVG